MVDIAGAVTFIEAHGTPAHRALARFVLGGATAPDVLAVLRPLHTADGGWDLTSPLAPGPIAASVRALQWLRWLSADASPLVDNTAAFLEVKQADDGSWPAPPDAPAGTDLLLTAAAARMLMETGRDTKVYFGRALTFLSGAWERGDVHEHAPITTMAMMLPLFKIGGQPSDAPIVEGCNLALRAYIDRPKPDPAAVVTTAHAALNTRYAGNQLYIAARNRALTLQAPDGGWEAAEAAQRPDVTVDALMLLRWGGLL